MKKNKILHIPFFNYNVVYIAFPVLGLGFVYRRQNDKPFKFAWLKFTWNTPYDCYASKVCKFKEMFQKWDVMSENI